MSDSNNNDKPLESNSAIGKVGGRIARYGRILCAAA